MTANRLERLIESLLFEDGVPGAYYEVDQKEASEIGWVLKVLRSVSPVSDEEVVRLAADLRRKEGPA